MGHGLSTACVFPFPLYDRGKETNIRESRRIFGDGGNVPFKNESEIERNLKDARSIIEDVTGRYQDEKEANEKRIRELEEERDILVRDLEVAKDDARSALVMLKEANAALDDARQTAMERSERQE